MPSDICLFSLLATSRRMIDVAGRRKYQSRSWKREVESTKKLCTVMHSCHPNTGEASLGYTVRPNLKKQT
jgi:hypothetical protein